VIAHSLCALLLAASATAAPQSFAAKPSAATRIKKLYEEQRYQEIVSLPEPAASAPPDVDYYRGMAFARLKRWDEAWKALRQGQLKAPADERFPVELAGVDFEKKNYRRAKSELHRALRLNPGDNYAENFLASLYYLDGNTAAALKYWNRAGKPQVSKVLVSPQPQLKPGLLSNALDVSPGQVLNLRQYNNTVSRLQAVGVFPQFRFELLPTNGPAYNLALHPVESNDWGDSTAAALVSLLRGIPYESIYPSVYNIHRSALNVTSLLRWDPNKQRVFAAVSGPLAGSARTRYQFYLDGRKENWNLNPAFTSATPGATAFRMEKIEGGAEILSVVNDRLAVRGGIDISGRSYANFASAQALAPGFFANGLVLQAQTSARYRLLDYPDRRLTVDATGAIQAGHDFAAGLNDFAQTEGGFDFRWLPLASADDYEMTAQLRTGHTFGMVPFDDLFMLGLERDNNLWLRGHIGTNDGMKGSAPMGRDYTLTNWEDDKIIFQDGLFRVRLGPFLDSGRISDPSGVFGSRRWMWDTGLELKVSVLGSTEVALFLGKDLLTGQTSVYGATLSSLNRPYPTGPTPFWGY
jgi:hypothetical protein